MHRATIKAIEQLLREAGSAHGRYEETVLNGVYDEDWPDWYAQWAVEHGFNDLVTRPVEVEQLSRFLVDLHEAHQTAGSGQPWPAFYARRLAERLGEPAPFFKKPR